MVEFSFPITDICRDIEYGPAVPEARFLIGKNGAGFIAFWTHEFGFESEGELRSDTPRKLAEEIIMFIEERQIIELVVRFLENVDGIVALKESEVGDFWSGYVQRSRNG